MAASKGRTFVIKRGDGADPEVFTAFAGMRSNEWSINNEMIDVTNKDSNGFRELISGGVVSMDLSGSGVFNDDDAYKAARADCLNPDQVASNYEILDGTTGDKFSGAFFVDTNGESGEFNGEVTYSITLKSSGAIAFEAA